jgi:hypothetical protein
MAYTGVLFLWDFHPKMPEELPPDEPENLNVYRGPPRVLEIGCGDGAWCFMVKKAHPDWIVEGVDDADHWSKSKSGLNFRYVIRENKLYCRYLPFLFQRDFMEFDDAEEGNDCNYFGRVHLNQDNVEFTVRNISTLLSHSNPIPCHMYSFIRARDVFGKLDSYKGFLEDVRR